MNTTRTPKAFALITLAATLAAAGCQSRRPVQATGATPPPADAALVPAEPSTDQSSLSTQPTTVAVAQQDRNPGAPREPRPSGSPASGVPAAATGPTTPATAPMATGPVERTPRSYVAADADDATLLRNWPLSVNTYPSGHVIAGPTYRVILPPPKSPGWRYPRDLGETAMTVPQFIFTPIWMFITPPWTPVEYHGDQFPPSYTVNDPLPYYVDEKVPGIVQLKLHDRILQHGKPKGE